MNERNKAVRMSCEMRWEGWTSLPVLCDPPAGLSQTGRWRERVCGVCGVCGVREGPWSGPWRTERPLMQCGEASLKFTHVKIKWKQLPTGTPTGARPPQRQILCFDLITFLHRFRLFKQTWWSFITHQTAAVYEVIKVMNTLMMNNYNPIIYYILFCIMTTFAFTTLILMLILLYFYLSKILNAGLLLYFYL